MHKHYVSKANKYQGLMEHSCDPSVQEAEEDQKLKVSLGCLARLCLKKKMTKDKESPAYW